MIDDTADHLESDGFCPADRRAVDALTDVVDERTIHTAGGPSRAGQATIVVRLERIEIARQAVADVAKKYNCFLW